MNRFSSTIGRSPNFESMMRSAHIVAATDVTVLIVGETGTGKELLANLLFDQSSRVGKRFLAINCGALPESIAESELFGHRKGAFTGATSNHKGLLQSAHGGTLFMDEVDSLPLSLQAKLLRFLETGECQPVGEARTEIVDVRIIAASNADLSKKVGTGEFRKDLYYRLNVVPLVVPPLRERQSDIETLTQYFLSEFADQHSTPRSGLSKTALNALKSYDWPGNIRELRNLCERLSILLAGQTIERENLPPEILTTDTPILTTDTPNRRSAFDLPKTGLNLETLEIDFIHQALARTGGNRTKSARLLGMTRDTFLYRIQKYGIS